MIIFKVASGEAAAIQRHYEQIIEVLLQTLLNAKHDNQRQGLKIFDGNRLVYGHDKNQFRDELSGLSGQFLNPQIIVQLQHQISRDGSLYKITESETGKLLMQFRSTNLGVRVEAGNLEPTHIKDINALERSLKRHEPIPASFTPVGKQEAEYFARIDKITNTLVQYAIAHQRNVEIDGLFSYKWQATTDGKVNIYAKDGRGSVLEKSEGQLKSSMSERDLIYFEQILPKLQPAYQRQQESTALRSPTVGRSPSPKINSNELER